MIYTHRFTPRIKQILKQGGVGVIPTDTIYGLVGSALSKPTVERIYKLRQRDLQKPMIVLIGSMKDLQLFHISVDMKVKKILQKLWPGKISIILPWGVVKQSSTIPPCKSKKFSYLHRGKNTIAFRFPRVKSLQNLLKYAGPLVAPSANISGKPPATTITQAQKYFGDNIDFYVDKGKCVSPPSTLIQIKNNKIIVKRKGAESPLSFTQSAE